MFRFIVFCLLASLCLAQAPVTEPPASEPPPPAVDEALRARMNQFFQYHVEGKFRQAEALVAEDTKDYFFSAAKPKYLSYEIKSIAYSKDFTEAKAVLLVEMFLMMPGFTDKPVKVPIGSTWKLIDGQWFWHVDPESLRESPFGKMSPGKPTTGAPPSIPAIPTLADMNFIYKQVKADKEQVTLRPGESQEVTFTNSATGLMSISLKAELTGVDVKLDRMDMKAGEKAVLTLRARDGAKPGTVSVLVEQTNHVIPIQVQISE